MKRPLLVSGFVLLFLMVAAVGVFAQTATPTPTRTPTPTATAPANLGSWWGCYTDKVGSTWSNYICAPSSAGVWETMITATSPGGAGLVTTERRFSFHPPSGIISFTLTCENSVGVSAPSSSSGTASSDSQISTLLTETGGWNITMVDSSSVPTPTNLSLNSVTYSWPAPYSQSDWPTYVTSLAWNTSATTKPAQIRLFANANGVGANTASSYSGFICQVDAWRTSTQSSGWQSTPTSTPAPTGIATPTPVGAWVSTPWANNPWYSTPADVDFDITENSTACYILLPGYTTSGTYFGYLIDFSWEQYQVCLTGYNLIVVFFGHNLGVWAAIVVSFGGFAIFYNRITKGD